MQNLFNLIIGLAFGLVIGALYILFQAETPISPEYFPPRPLMILWLKIQLATHGFFAVWIFARAGTHIKRLSATHPTLGNFTNLKYTFTRLISPADFLVLFALNLLAMLLFYLLAR